MKKVLFILSLLACGKEPVLLQQTTSTELRVVEIKPSGYFLDPHTPLKLYFSAPLPKKYKVSLSALSHPKIDIESILLEDQKTLEIRVKEFVNPNEKLLLQIETKEHTLEIAFETPGFLEASLHAAGDIRPLQKRFFLQFSRPLLASEVMDLELLNMDKLPLKIAKRLQSPKGDGVEMVLEEGVKENQSYVWHLKAHEMNGRPEPEVRIPFLVGALSKLSEISLPFFIKQIQNRLQLQLTQAQAGSVWFWYGPSEENLDCDKGPCPLALNPLVPMDMTVNLQANSYAYRWLSENPEGKLRTGKGKIQLKPYEQVFIKTIKDAVGLKGEYVQIVNDSEQPVLLNDWALEVNGGKELGGKTCVLKLLNHFIFWPKEMAFLVGEDFKGSFYPLITPSQVARLSSKSICGSLKEAQSLKLINPNGIATSLWKRF